MQHFSLAEYHSGLQVNCVKDLLIC